MLLLLKVTKNLFEKVTMYSYYKGYDGLFLRVLQKLDQENYCSGYYKLLLLEVPIDLMKNMLLHFTFLSRYLSSFSLSSLFQIKRSSVLG